MSQYLSLEQHSRTYLDLNLEQVIELIFDQYLTVHETNRVDARNYQKKAHNRLMSIHRSYHFCVCLLTKSTTKVGRRRRIEK